MHYKNEVTKIIYSLVAGQGLDIDFEVGLVHHLMDDYHKSLVDSDCMSNVMPFIGTSVFKKNNKGHSKIKNVTVGKMYEITQKHDRSKIRAYRPKMNDGFYIVNDIGVEVSFTNLKMWDVYWA